VVNFLPESNEGSLMASVAEKIVTQPKELEECCQYLAGYPRLGMDTEFVGEDSYHPNLCLVQVATDDRLMVIDPLTTGPLDEFWKLIVDPDRQIIVHAGREEVRLCRLWAGKAPGNLFDLQVAAGLVGMAYPLGHGALVGQLLGVSLSKGETLTEWRDRPLTRSQIQYALDDVRYLLPLWQKLSTKLEDLSRSDWANEEFARLTGQTEADESEPETNEKWRRLRSLGSLDRRRLAVVRALYSWREETAERTNRPARAVCRDDLLVEIARRNPSRPRDLQVIRGLAHRHLDAIFQVIVETRNMPPDQFPPPIDRDQDPPQVGWFTNILMSVLGDLCVRKKLAPNLAATNADIKSLVRSRLRGEAALPNTLLTQGWRSEQILPELLSVLEGRRSVRISDLKSETPLSIE
jgi:ribonuclease D